MRSHRPTRRDPAVVLADAVFDAALERAWTRHYLRAGNRPAASRRARAWAQRLDTARVVCGLLGVRR